jgi:hypothetical protein
MKGFDPFPNSASVAKEEETEKKRVNGGGRDEDEDGHEIEEYGFECHVGSRYKNLCKELYGDEFEQWEEEDVWGGREREVWDLTATMVSSCGDFFAGETESGDSKLDRLCLLKS